MVITGCIAGNAHRSRSNQPYPQPCGPGFTAALCRSARGSLGLSGDAQRSRKGRVRPAAVQQLSGLCDPVADLESEVLDECILACPVVAAGSTPPPSLLGTHRSGTIIGDALRSSALTSVMHCDPEWFLLHVLKNASLRNATLRQLELDAAELQRAGREVNHFLLEPWLAGAAASNEVAQ